MKRFVVVAVAFGLTVPARAGQELSFTYDQVMTTSKGIFVTKVWVKGNKKRTETDRPGGQEIDIMQANTYIQIFPDLGIARKMPLAIGALAGPMPSMPARDQAAGGERKQPPSQPLGMETIANFPCKIYELKGDGGVTRVWVSDVLPFPLKWEEDDKKDGKFSYEIKNLKVSANISDDLFKVPTGIKLMDENLQEIPTEISP